MCKQKQRRRKMENKSNLKINEEVVAKIASMAALEIEGVDSMSNKAPVDIKKILNKGAASKSVKIGVVDGTVNIDIYICVLQSANVKAVCESVQLNVKEKLQNMTGNAITKVNVHVADLKADPEEEPADDAE